MTSRDVQQGHGASEKAVMLTRFEMNAAMVALGDTYRINPRSEQQNAADRAYYKLNDAARESFRDAERGPSDA